MTKDPCKGVICIVDDQVLKKDVLSQEEIQKLMETHYQFEKENVRNASSSASTQACISAMSKTCATQTLTMPTNSCASSKTRPKDTPPVVGSPSPSMMDLFIW